MIFAVSADTVAQLTANGIFRGTAYGLLGVGFALILGVTGRFHFAYAFTYTLAAYLIYTFDDRVGLPFWVAVAAGLVAITAIGVGIERVVYRPLATHAGANALLAVFVAALGITIAGENLIRLFWSSSNQNLIGPKRSLIEIGPVQFLNYDVYQALTAVAFVVVLTLVLRFTSLGRMIKAVRSNPGLAQAIGISSNSVYLIVFAIGTLAGGLAAFWYAVQFTIDPTMGFKPTIFAFVVAFLAGTASSPVRVFLVGILIALIEQYASIWLSVRWTQTAVFVVLVAYLVVLSLKGKFSLRIRRHSAARA